MKPTPPTPKAPCPLAVMDNAADRLAVVIESDNEDALHGASPDDVNARKALIEARAKVAELVAADRDYEQARRNWDYAIMDPTALSGPEMERIADAFESAVTRRAAALAAFGEVAK